MPLFSLHGKYSFSSTFIQNFKLIALFCGGTGQFVSDMDGNPEGRCSCVVAQMGWVLMVVCKVDY